MNKKTLLTAAAIVCGLTAAVNADARKPAVIKGGKLCERYLLKKVAGEKAEGSRVVKLKAFDRKGDNLPPDVKRWLESADEETLGAHELRYGRKRALLLNAIGRAATGLAVNFQYWYVESGNHSVEFMSRSENPRLIFWDRDGSLNYYSVDFSDDFVPKKDWDNVTLNLLRYKVSADGESQLISKESNVRCE